MDRRRLLTAGGSLAGMSIAGMPIRRVLGREQAAPEQANARRLSLLNLHTSERVDLIFARGDRYVPESLAAIQILLRDFRTGGQHVTDPQLMDYLYDLAQRAGVDPIFSVISGYRSPRTNEQLRERSDGVARHSLHLEGRAIDVRLAGVGCADLASHARGMSRGGVGYYRQSDFVHVDTGAFRTWNG